MSKIRSGQTHLVGRAVAAPALAPPPLAFETHIDAPVERVWRAWTDSKEVSRWFAPEANVEPRVGGAFELFFWPQDHRVNSTLGCRITRLEPQRYLGFTWRGPQAHASAMEKGDPPPPPTHVMLVLESTSGGKGTQVRVQHTGWGAGPGWEAARAWHQGPWTFALHNVKALCESGQPLPPPVTPPTNP